MSKLPAFQFYPADWRKSTDVQAMSFHDRGVWFEILCLMHESTERGRLLLSGEPMSNEILAKLLGVSVKKLQKSLEILLSFGVAFRDENGALCNRRMIRDEHVRRVRAESGKLGGNPSLLNQRDNQSNKQKQTPSSSSSITSSSSERKEETPPASPAPEGSKRRGTRIPEPFILTSEMRAYAAEKRPGLDVTEETEKFCNHWRAKSGREATKLDWGLTWKNWILNARGSTNGTYGSNKTQGSRNHRPIDSNVLAGAASVVR